MGKYNASPLRIISMPRRAMPALGAAVLLSLAAGCASEQGKNERSPAPAPLQTTPAPAPNVQRLDNNADANAAAGTLSLREDAPLRYVVKKGDTLWDISKYFLRDAWQWPELWYVNGQVKNPHLIYPGEVLTLVTVDGRTRLVRDSAIERLSPRIREEALDSALPAIPIEAIRNFLRGPRVVTLDEAKKAPYVLAFVDEHIAASANTDIYVKNAPPTENLSYAIVQIGEPYRDPDTRELLGYEAIPAGESELRVPGQPATMRVTKSTREILIADRLLPIEAESFEANFYPHPPANPVDGRIISVFDGISQIAQYQIVAMNRGSDQGLDPGTVLSIYQSGRAAPDPYAPGSVLLPDLYEGVLLVFKVTPRLSYGLVMNSNRPLHVLDKVKNPVPEPH